MDTRQVKKETTMNYRDNLVDLLIERRERLGLDEGLKKSGRILGKPFQSTLAAGQAEVERRREAPGLGAWNRNVTPDRPVWQDKPMTRINTAPTSDVPDVPKSVQRHKTYGDAASAFRREVTKTGVKAGSQVVEPITQSGKSSIPDTGTGFGKKIYRHSEKAAKVSRLLGKLQARDTTGRAGDARAGKLAKRLTTMQKGMERTSALRRRILNPNTDISNVARRVDSIGATHPTNPWTRAL